MAQCDAQHVGSIPSGQTNPTHVGERTQSKPARATQTIPPALRRQVVRRDHGCCVVPGCRNATFIDVHHIQPRAEGGQHVADNLVVLCSAHHRAVHRGLLVIAGTVASGLTFTRADGASYGIAAATQAVR
jgi:hypothetical protein